MDPPEVTTGAVTEVSDTGAKLSGSVTSDGGVTVTKRGFVYGTAPDPEIGGQGVTKVTAGSGIGDFTANLEELELDTEYYVRAYAVNSEGTAYGETVSFRTEEEGGEEEEEKEPDGDTKTGDSGLPWVWWLLCSVAAAGITVLIVSKKGSLHSLRYSLYRSFLLDFWISIMRLAFRKVFLNLCGIIKKANIYVCCVYKALIQYKF